MKKISTLFIALFVWFIFLPQALADTPVSPSNILEQDLYAGVEGYLTVTTATDVVNPDDGLLSLREAIAAALAGDTINFDPGLSGESIMLLLGQLTIDKDLTIEGLGALQLIVDGNDTSNVFEITSTAVVSISGVTITGGNAITVDGGGILNWGTLTLVDTNVTGNVAVDDAGGILNLGTLVMTNSTVSGNSGGDVGGGILNDGSLTMTNSSVSGNMLSGIINFGLFSMTNSTVSDNLGDGIINIGSLTITNSTFSRNTDDGISTQGGTLMLLNSTVSSNTGHGINISSSSGRVDLKNTIVVGNTDTDCSDSFGGLTSLGYNLLSAGSGCPTDGSGDLTVDPAVVFETVLSSLQDNGGPTETHALLAGSPAIDAGEVVCTDPDGVPLTTDQRGEPRPVDGNGDGTTACDIGAFEVQVGLQTVDIDIKPFSELNAINPRSEESILVAILSDLEAPFDPSSQIDIPTVVFGPAGAKTTRYRVRDINEDGLGDLVLRFNIPNTGIACGDTVATLTGETFDGMTFSGTDSIKTVRCKP